MIVIAHQHLTLRTIRDATSRWVIRLTPFGPPPIGLGCLFMSFNNPRICTGCFGQGIPRDDHVDDAHRGKQPMHIGTVQVQHKQSNAPNQRLRQQHHGPTSTNEQGVPTTQTGVRIAFVQFTHFCIGVCAGQFWNARQIVVLRMVGVVQVGGFGGFGSEGGGGGGTGGTTD